MKQTRQMIQCQESGLPLLKDPKWHNIHKNNYHYSYTKVGEAIVHVHNRGNVKHFDSTIHAGLIKEFVRDTGVNIPYVEIRDFKYIDGRGSYKQIQATKEYILANQKNLAGFMYCNMPFWVRSITRAGFKAYTVSTKFAACKTYDQAIEKAMEVLGNRQGGFKSTPILSFDQIRFTTGWQYENPDRGLVYKNGVITDRLFFSSIQADSVADEDMDPLLFAMEQVFKDGAITESGYIRIADYSGLKRMSLRARRRYGQALNHLAKTYDARPGATYVCGANLVIRSSIKLFSGFINQKIRFTDSVPAAFKEINKLESLQTTGNKNIIVTAQNIEEINELCGIMLWPEEEIQDKSIGKLSRDNPLMELSETLKVVHTDLADLRRRKAEQIRKVELARKEAEAANRAKSDFLANMSHEIRTPMNGVIGMLDILKETSLDKIQKEFLETAGQSAEALLGIVNDILDFSKIESGKMTIETISFNLRELLDSVNDVIAVEAFGKGLEFGSLMTSEVPDYIESDPGRLRQVLTNLIQNAVKFVTHGEVFVRVSLDSIETSQLTLLFEITDTGIGIPKEKRDGLFDAFTQVDTSTTRIYGGTGLGLAITRQLVEIMGGNIGVESEPNQGSRFWFTLPVKGQSQPNDLPGPGFKDIPPVLILSPDSLTRRILTAYLTEWNCPHEIIEDIQSKLAAIDTKGKRRLILADSRRTDLAEQIALASEAPEISFITMTPVGARPPALLSAQDSGAWLSIPLKKRQLLACIDMAQKNPATQLSKKQRCSNSSPATPATGEDNTCLENQIRILMAEDNLVNQKIVLSMLPQNIYHITTAGDGTEALRQFKKNTYDLILMDIQMPKMGGLEAARKIRVFEKNTIGRIPILALTANAMQGDRDNCLAAGMDAYLAKPFQKGQLINLIQTLCKDKKL